MNSFEIITFYSYQRLQNQKYHVQIPRLASYKINDYSSMKILSQSLSFRTFTCFCFKIIIYFLFKYIIFTENLNLNFFC